MAQPLKLVTIRFSHYCEKARWTLDWHRVPYTEATYLPGLSAFGVAVNGGLFSGRADRVSTRYSTPLLVGDGKAIHDSTAICRYVDQKYSTPEESLYAASETKGLEEHFHDRFGSHTRRVAYSYLLSDPELLFEMFEANSGALQTRIVRTGWPLFRAMFDKLGLAADKVAKSRDSIDREFDAVAQRLHAHRGDYLLPGNKLSAADISFCALAAPVLVIQPWEGFGGYLPPVEQLPETFRDRVRDYRSHEAGQYAVRMFRIHRGKRIIPALPALITDPQHDVHGSAGRPS